LTVTVDSATLPVCLPVGHRSSHANSHHDSIQSVSAPSGFWRRLQNAGIEPGDSEELRLNKSLLMLATGLASVGIIFWVAIYSILGPQFSYTAPFAFQLLLAGNMLLYIMSRNFDFFRISQLSLFLFLPFIAQWSGGTIITTSGVVLWALLAPVGAILCIGVRISRSAGSSPGSCLPPSPAWSTYTLSTSR
jgi:hypothetical protein